MNEFTRRLAGFGVIPVITIDDASHAVPLARALREGGLPVAEITFRTDAAAGAIRNIVREEPDVFVGAGTVLTLDQAREAVDAGASFIVAPGFNPRICRWCIEQGIPVAPGVDSPTLIEQAMELGLELLKFFPAEASGGLAYLKAISGPYRGVRFMPTGGLTQDNLGEYLGNESVAACGGSWLAPPGLVREERFGEIRDITRRAVELVNSLPRKKPE